MLDAEIQCIESAVADAAAQSRFMSFYRGVTVEAPREEGDVLRIVLSVMPLDAVSDEDLDAFSRSIENAVSRIDPRLPSIRFAEAA